MKRHNIECLLDLVDALRREDDEAVRAMFDPAVYWQGASPRDACATRDEVVTFMARQREGLIDVDSIELIGAERHAIMCVRAEHADDDSGLPDALYNVFAISDGTITRIDEFEHREQALAAAGLDGR